MKVGIVGTGTMGAAHARAWQATDASIVGLCASNKDSANSLAEVIQTPVFDSYEQLLQTVDIIDICTPTDLHKDMVLQAAAAGKHIICEKPIALKVEDAQEMIDACKQAQVRLFIALVVRFFPQYRKAQEAISSGQLGKLGLIRLKRVAYQPLGDAAWFTDESRSGGLLVDLMLHDFDYARWLAGPVKRVYAKSIRSQNPKAPSDYSLVTLSFANNTKALIEGGWAYPAGTFRVAMDIAGEDGVIEWNSDDSQTIKTFLKPSESEGVARVGIPSSGSEDPYTTQIKHAYDAIKHRKPFLVTAEDGLEALRIALAAKESLQTGQAVTLGGN